MTTLRCAGAALLIGAFFPVAASATSLHYYEESIEYRLEYFRPVGGGSVYIDNSLRLPSELTAHVYPGSEVTGYVNNPWEYIRLQFINYGVSNLGSTEDLTGTTLDFDNLMNGSLFNNLPLLVLEMEGVIWEGEFKEDSMGDRPRMSGSVTFDDFGVSSHQDVFVWTSWGEEFWATSSVPQSLAGWDVSNPEVLEGLLGYDSRRGYDFISYTLHPGQWRVASATKTCWSSQNNWDWEGVECRTPLAPVPLPASAWLLLSGLGALGARGAWKRRRAAA